MSEKIGIGVASKPSMKSSDTSEERKSRKATHSGRRGHGSNSASYEATAIIQQATRKKRSHSQVQKEYRRRQREKHERIQRDLETQLADLEHTKAENARLKKEQEELEKRVADSVAEYGTAVQRQVGYGPSPPASVTWGILQSIQWLFDSAVEYAIPPTERAMGWILRNVIRVFGLQFLQYIVPILQGRLKSICHDIEIYPERRQENMKKLDCIMITRRRLLECQFNADPDFFLKALLNSWVGDEYNEGICMPGVPRVPENKVREMIARIKLSSPQLARLKMAWCSFVSDWNGTRDEMYDQVMALSTEIGSHGGHRADSLGLGLSLNWSAKNVSSLSVRVRQLEEITAIQRDAACKLLFQVMDTVDSNQAAQIITYYPGYIPHVMYFTRALAFSDIPSPSTPANLDDPASPSGGSDAVSP